MPREKRAVLVIVIGLAVLAAAWVLSARMRVERGNKTVAIAVDYNLLVELAAMSGTDTVEALKQMKAAGATHVLVREQSVGDLIDERKVQLFEGDDFAIVLPSPSVRKRVLVQLQQRLPGGRPYTGPSADLKLDMSDYRALPPGPGILYDNLRTLDLLRPMGVGYREKALEDARAAGLKVVARPIAEMALTKQAISASLDAMAAAGSNIAVFSGLEVYGVHDLVRYAGEEMKKRGVQFGYVEMAKQFGDDKLAASMDYQIIRCHAVAQAEMVKVPPARAVERFVKAVRERNVRLCYLRPYDRAAESPLQAADDYVSSVARELRDGGFALGDPQVYPEVTVRAGALAVLLAGVGAALIWLIGIFVPLPSGIFWGLVVADLVLSLGASVAARGLATGAGPLAAVTLFPILALAGIRIPHPGRELSVWRGLGLFLAISGASAVGGLIAAACISDSPHMMQIALFRGVKLAQVLPLMVAALLFLARGSDAYAEAEKAQPDGPEWRPLLAGAGEVCGALVRYWHVALMLVGLAAAAVMLMRSGNVSALPPSEMELTVRSLLDKLLLVRPRTKEILLGHPLMIISLTLLLAGQRRGIWIGMVAGAIGQVSLANTFGHIHTPLVLTLLRVFNGLWVGALIGLVAWLVIQPWVKKLQRLT